ncbi:sugar ABC transporter substrate-binding protein [bacterium]|nr:sugar ABC transporter substrate-binding protein [bacterium]
MKKLLIFFLLLLITCTGCVKKETYTKIQFASWGSKSEIDILKPIINDFEKENPNIKIEFLHIPQNYFQKIHLLFASNMAPDVIFINNLYLPVYADYLEDLSDYTDESTFFEQTLQSLTYDKKLLAIPRDASNMVIYYNKDLFDECKISYPSENWTLQDLLIIGKQFKKHNIFGISFEENPIFYLPYLMSNDGGILSDDLKTIIVNEKNSAESLAFYSDLRNKYNIAPKKSQSSSLTMAQMFLQEKLAMHLSGRWLVPKYRESADFDWDIINFPNGSKGSIVPMDASGWSVYKKSKNKAIAIKFVKFLSSKENIERFTKSGLITPARIDVATSKTFLQGKPESSYIFINAIKTSKPTAVSKNYNEIIDKVNEQTEKIFNK